MRPARLCFHVPYLYPLVAAGPVRYTGGLEVQQWLITRALARRGFDVQVVTCDFGQPPVVTHEGVTFHRSFPPHAGLPGIRFFHPRLTATTAALAAADADVYVMKGSGLLAGVTLDVARARGRKFAFLCSHDMDAWHRRPDLRPWEDWWSRRALRHADLRIAQTRWQRDEFARSWNLPFEVVPNAVERVAHPSDPGQPGSVVWLATYKESKRPGWFTDLATRMPHQRFVMHGVIPEPPLTREAYDQALRVAATHSNLEVGGFLDHDQLSGLFAGAALLVHTSPAEGFSNVFLEAWAHGIPTVTTVDPDQVIAREGLGIVASDPGALHEAVAALLADPEQRRAIGARARAYVAREHDLERIADRYRQLFDEVLARPLSR